MENWGDELERARLAAGFRYRKDLAAASGVNKGTIDELEQGKRMPRQDTLAALRRVLPGLRHPLEVHVTEDEIVVHLPMDRDARARMLTELLQQTLSEKPST